MTIDLKSHVFHILKDIGEDTERNGLKDTPKRVSKSLTFLTKGYRENLDEIVNGAIFDSSNKDMVVLKDIEFYSLCEHHLLPFFGTCHIAYLPKGHVIGLSKIARIVDHFARRLQIQETLTLQIAEALRHYLQTDDVGVIMNAQHMCMSMRGVNKQSASATTSTWLGEFKTSDRTRCEFMERI